MRVIVKKLNDKGAALLNVLLITTFALLLVSSVLALALNSYKIKSISLNAADNFYICETIMEEIKADIRNKINTSSSIENFYKAYQSTDRIGIEGGDIYNYCYDIRTIAKAVTSVDGSSSIVYSEPVTTPYTINGSYSTYVTLTVDKINGMTDTVVIGSYGQTRNNLILSGTQVTFAGLTVKYMSGTGYESQISTDIVVLYSGATAGEPDKAYRWNTVLETSHSSGINDKVYDTSYYEKDSIYAIQFTMTLGGRYEPDSPLETYAQALPYVYVADKLDDNVTKTYASGKKWKTYDDPYKSGEYLNLFENVYVYVGPENGDPNADLSGLTDKELEDAGWIKYTEIFQTSNSAKSKEGYIVSSTGYSERYGFQYTDNKTTVSRFKDKYGLNNDIVDGENRNTQYIDIRYMVKLTDSSGNSIADNYVDVAAVGWFYYYDRKENYEYTADDAAISNACVCVKKDGTTTATTTSEIKLNASDYTYYWNMGKGYGYVENSSEQHGRGWGWGWNSGKTYLYYKCDISLDGVSYEAGDEVVVTLKGPTDTTYAYLYADSTPLTYSSYITEGDTLIATFRVTEDGSGGTLYIFADKVSDSNTVSAVLKHTTVTTTTALGYSSATVSYANWRKE